MKHFRFLMLILLITIYSCTRKTEPPQPYGALPSEDQLKWQQMEYYMFIHFGPNTFTNVEWGDGKEDPQVFNPTEVDCRQWAATAKAAGMKAIIITAKHHDGFCLWPSQYSTHTVRESRWKDGKGDLLKELSEACKEYGLKFGVYLSPWDQNHPSYGTPEYNQVFVNTLTEVLTGYGEVFEQWFDGANGGGKDGKKQEYDWDLFHATVYKHQPHAIIFSDIGPGCRWMGNERGIAGKTNWSTLNIEGFGPGHDAPPTDTLNAGNVNGKAWIPAETDVSIRPGWFYSPATDDKVKSLEHLVDIYYTSVGRNSNLLLNVPPDRKGRIHPNDSTRLMEFKAIMDQTFENNLAKKAKAAASATRGNADSFGPRNLFDNDYDTYWTTDDEITTASIEVELPGLETFNRIVLQEYIPLGQRIAKFSIEYLDIEESKWKSLAEETTIGYKRILRFPTITTQQIRINITQAWACPILNNLEIYKAPEFLSLPVINRDKQGLVSIHCNTPDPVIYYTIDGTEPSVSSIRYEQAFPLPDGGTVKAVATIDNNKQVSERSMREFDIAPSRWTVVSPEDANAEKIIDGNDQTFASLTKEKPLIIDLGEVISLKGFYYVPATRNNVPHIYKYNLSISPDKEQWTSIQTNGIFNNIKNNPIRQDVNFNRSYSGRYLQLEPVETTVPAENFTLAEVGVLTK